MNHKNNQLETKLQKENFNIREYAINGIQNRNKIDSLEGLNNRFLILRKKSNDKLEECYESAFLFNDKFKDYFVQNGGVKGFKGTVFTDRVFVDIDYDNLNEALESTKIVLSHFDEIGIDLNTVRIYFSGSKGFHIELPSNLFDIKPSNKLPDYLKVLVTRLIPDDVQIDTSIYDVTRLWRMSNTINKKSGLYKIPVTANEIINLPLYKIEELAKSPRTGVFFEDNVTSIPELVDLYKGVTAYVENNDGYGKSDGQGNKLYNNIYKEPIKKGLRNSTLVSKAGESRAKGLIIEDTKHLLYSINENQCDPPLEQKEVDNIVESIYKYENESGHEFNKFESSKKGHTQAEKLVGYIENDSLILFKDQYNEPYVQIKEYEHFEIHKVRSIHFKIWCSNLFWKKEKKAISPVILNSALNVIEAKARFEGSKYTLHNRVAWHENSIWYDLGNGKLVKINKSGWEIVDEPPILFKRYPHQKEQVLPQRTAGVAELDDIFKFVTITNEGEKRLYKANLISSFVPDIPHPIDILIGDQGTAKTTRSRIKKELVDPSHLDTLTVPKDPTEFVQMADHHWFFTLDNLTSLPNWLSDGLCRVSTGDGFSKRRLYTDDEDFIYKYKRCACITGINLVATKPDLLDRSIIYELEPIPEDKRKTEKKFWEEFDAVKGRILGTCFTVLSKTMNEYDTVAPARVPRMADFATWGCAVTKALGGTEEDFLEAYQSNIRVQNKEAIEASPVATLIIEFMQRQEEREGRRQWDGSPTELLLDLKDIADELCIDTKHKQFPKDPNWLWRRIKEVRTNLMAVGIIVSRDDRSSTERRIKIVKKSISDLDGDDTNDDSSDNMIENGVTRKYLESLENDSSDSNDSIFEDLLENKDIPERDPWDED